MTTLLPRGALERAGQGASAPLGAVQCNLGRKVANRVVGVALFRDIVARLRKPMASAIERDA